MLINFLNSLFSLIFVLYYNQTFAAIVSSMPEVKYYEFVNVSKKKGK
jgi:hypothetical protein